MSFWNALLFPQENACHLCGRHMADAGPVCDVCLKSLRRLRLPCPMSRALPTLSGSVAVCAHSGAARRMIHQLKYRSDPAMASLMGLMMASVLDGPAFDAVLPVPLHPAREAERGYNQAALLAQAVCRHTELAYEPHALRRVLPTDSQVRRTRQERLSSMRSAFHAPSPALVSGRRLMLVDDVVTTGATAIACAEELLQAGAREVLLLTFCRAQPKPIDTPSPGVLS